MSQDHPVFRRQAPHLHAPLTTERIMLLVVLALIPALAVKFWFYGAGVIWQLLTSSLTALACTALCARLRERPLRHYLSDFSWLVTATILALSLPPLLPWQYNVTATAFAILLVREAFGGLGMNIFNPAMAGFIFVLISSSSIFYPSWVSPAPRAFAVADFPATSQVIFAGGDVEKLKDAIAAQIPDPNAIPGTADARSGATDASSGATWLNTIKVARKAGLERSLLTFNPREPDDRAYVAEAIAYCAGGLLLIALRIILLRMVLAFLGTYALLAWLIHEWWPLDTIAMSANLLLGGVMLAAFFIITDPVTNAGTSRGRIIYAMLVAVLILLIRQFSSYADSVAFAVLLGNACAPLIDVLTRRRPFGIGFHDGGSRP